MKFVSASKMKEIDKAAIEKFGIPALILMENAGLCVVDEAGKMLGNKKGKVVIFCGYGNNGGDGFVVARHLKNRGYAPVVFLVGSEKKMSPQTKINFEILGKMKIKVKRIANQSQIKGLHKYISRAKLFIDAIFGIGIKGRLDEFYSQLFKNLNNTNIRTLSIDIPSGLDADRGIALPIAKKANRTVVMGMAKKGFLNPAAGKYLGKIIIADISLPNQLLV